MTCSSLAIPLKSGELYQALFMLRYEFFFQQIGKDYGHNMAKLLQSKSVSECADQAIWLA